MNRTNLKGTKLINKSFLEKGTQECSVCYCVMRNSERTTCMFKCHVLLWYSEKMCYHEDLELWLPWCSAGFPVLNVGPIKADVWPNLYKYSKRLVVICWILIMTPRSIIMIAIPFFIIVGILSPDPAAGEFLLSLLQFDQEHWIYWRLDILFKLAWNA